MRVTPDMVRGLSETLLCEGYDGALLTPEFHSTVWEFCCSPARQVAIAAPRGHAKSTAVTLSYLLTVLLFRERHYAVIVSETEAQSKQFLHDLKKVLLENEKLKKLFNIVGLVRDNETEFVAKAGDGHTFRVIAKGSGQAVRGLKIDGRRPDIIIGDDLEGDEQVGNEERRTKFRRWFYGALLPVLSDSGIVRVVGTILHMDSALERMMPENQVPEGKDKAAFLYVGETEVKATSDEYDWFSVRFMAHSPDFSHILWPEKFPRRRLEALRQVAINQGIPDSYSQEYLNRPIDAESAFFRSTDLRDFTFENEDGIKYVSMDLAASKKTHANYSAFCVGAMTSRNVLRVEAMERGRLDSLEIAEKIFDLQRQHGPEIFVVEKGPIWSAIEPLVTRMSYERGVFPAIRAYHAAQDKQTRAQAIRARMRAGAVEVDTQAEWFPAFQDELLTFPRGKNDDMVDTLAWLGIALNDLASAPTKEEHENELYHAAVDAAFSFADNGVNATTGY